MVLGLLLVCGCGNALYAVRVTQASAELQRAEQLDAARRAPYEYFYALEHLKKARSEAVEADYGDAYHPLFLNNLPQPLRKKGDMWRAEGEAADVLWRGLTLSYLYRVVSDEFKPRYRRNPSGFDQYEGDQKGSRYKAVQHIRGWVFSGERV